MSQRLRLAHVTVQPVLLWDDGDNLTPGPATQAFNVSLPDMEGLADRLRADIAKMNEQQQPNQDAAALAEPDASVDGEDTEPDEVAAPEH